MQTCIPSQQLFSSPAQQFLSEQLTLIPFTMAPGRRGRPPGSSNSNPRAAQGTLAFGRNNKITKPSLPPSSSTKTSKPSSEEQVKDVAQIVDEGFSTEQGKEVEEDDDIKPAETVDEDPTLREGRATAMAIREAQKMETKEMDPMVEKAKKIPEAAVKRYWREREGERKAPRGSLTSSFLTNSPSFYLLTSSIL